MGLKMKILRKQRNFTQKQLANMFDVTEAAIRQYEQDKRTPDADYIIKFCKKFCVSADYLLLDIKSGERLNTEPIYQFICDIISKYKQSAHFEIANTNCDVSDSLDSLDEECNCMRFDAKRMLEGLSPCPR